MGDIDLGVRRLERAIRRQLEGIEEGERLECLEGGGGGVWCFAGTR